MAKLGREWASMEELHRVCVRMRAQARISVIFRSIDVDEQIYSTTHFYYVCPFDVRCSQQCWYLS